MSSRRRHRSRRLWQVLEYALQVDSLMDAEDCIKHRDLVIMCLVRRWLGDGDRVGRILGM
jgi:hypothetical protein